MRKAYIFRELTGQVRSFAAFVLITLLAVGNVFAQYSGSGTFTKINSLEELTTGYYVITEETGSDAMLNTGNNVLNVADAIFENPPANMVWRVDVATDGTITIYNEAVAKYVEYHGSTAQTGKNYAYLVDEVTDQSRWTPSLNDDGWIITNIGFPLRVLSYNYSSGNPRFACYGTNYTNFDRLAFYKMGDGGEAFTVAAPVFKNSLTGETLSSGAYYDPLSISLSCATEDAYLFYVIMDGSAEYYYFNAYTEPFTVNSTVTLAAKAIAYNEETEEEVESEITYLNITFPVELPNIAAFYNGVQDGLYKITGDVQYVWRHGRKMYVQDATGGLLVYDNPTSVITTQYNEGDIISGGIFGTFTTYKDLVELVPTVNTVAGTPGSAVVPQEVTVANVVDNADAYMSELVVLRNGTISVAQINNSTVYYFVQDGRQIQVYNSFGTLTHDFQDGEEVSLIGFVGRYNDNIQIFPRGNADIIPSYVTLPYSCNFDDASVWTLVNGDNTNKWYVGEAQGFDNNKLYISSSNGVTNKYNVSAASVSHAYVKVNLPTSDVKLSFVCRSVGDANDYLQVSLLDEAPEAGVLPDTYLKLIYGMEDFDAQNILIPASNAGVKYLVFTWNNDANGGAQTPAAIDNLIMYTTCTAPTNIVATVDGRSATITWDALEGQTAWEVQYKDVNSDAWQTVTANTPSVMLENLSTQVSYDVRVKTNCGLNGVSAWTNAQFAVPCVDGTPAPADVTIGNGANTTYNAPFGPYYKNSWIQMIYPASNFETPGYINSLSWEVNAANAQECSFLRIYIGTTTHENNTSTTDWLSMDDLTLVYEADNITIGAAAGWETYTFNTPYYYNGEENLVIVTSRSSSEYKSLYYKATGNNTNAVMYRWNDSDASYASYPGSSAATGRNANLPNMVVGYAEDCHDLHCAAPADLTVSNITTDGAVLNWEAGDATAWRVNYKAGDAADWTTVDVTENTYTLTDLEQNTNYMVRVMADCGTIGMSSEAAVNFTTEADCPAPYDVLVEAVMHTVNFSWMTVEGVNNYQVSVTGEGTDISLIVENASQANITGLQEHVQYTFAVRSLCGEESVSDWHSINFTMPTICAVPANFQVVGVGQTTANLVWSPGEANAWIVEYGLKGFTLGEGVQVTTNEPTLILTDLSPLTNYDVYVKTDCGLGYTSNWSSKKSFETQCGILTVTTANSYFEDFDTHYSGSGAKALSYCWTAPLTYTADNGVFPAVYTGYSDAAHSGANSLEVKGNSGMFTLPEFSNDINTLQITLWANTTASSASAAGTMEVGVLTDLDDPTTFVHVSTIELSAFGRNNTRFYGPFTFDNVAAQAGQRIAFRYTNESNPGESWNLDDFTVQLVPDCQTPTDLTVTSVTSSVAALSWTENGSATAWNIEYGPAGFEHGNGMVVAANANPFTVTGLDAATTYDFYVQGDCGFGSVSEWSIKTTATTLCSPILVTAENPWEEGFEEYVGNGGQPFICWETPVTYTADNGVFPLVYCGHAPACHTGTNSAEFKGNTNVLVLPEFVNNIYDLQLSFWANRTSSSNGNMEVGYITDVTDATTFVPVATTPAPRTRPYSGNGATDMGTYYFPFNAPANARMALRYTNTSASASWNLDDFTVSLAPSCREVSGLTVSDVTTTSATVTWSPGSAEGGSVLQYKASNSDDWTTVNTNATTVTLNNLAYSTDYSVRVKPACADETMAWLTSMFTTECANVVSTGNEEITIGTGTSTGNIAPMNAYYGNSWTQMIYPASSVGTAGQINSISWNKNGTASHSYQTLRIYLGTTTATTHSSTDDWVPENELTLVYDDSDGGTLSGSGWQEYTFSNPYNYDGKKSLVVVVSRTASGYTSGMNYYYTTSSNAVLYNRCDGNSSCGEYPSSSGTKSLNSNLPNVKFNIDGYACNDEHCADPMNLVVDTVTATSATLTWDAGDATTWRVGYKVAGTENWTSVETTSNTYELTGLTPTTTYDVRVKTLCSGDESNYITASLTTPMIPTALPYFTDFTEGGWMLNNSTSVNKWMMGTPSDKNYSALFVSDDGASASYTITSPCVISAEKLFALPADDSIHVVFDVEIGGESSFDYLKVFFAPSTSTYPASATSSTSYSGNSYSTYAFNFSDYLSQTGSTSYPYKLNLTQGDIIHVDMKVVNPAPNEQGKLVFAWRNDNSTGTNPGAIISNLQVGDGVICTAPTDLTATAVENGSSTITWTAGGEETSWVVTLTPNVGDVITTTVATPSYTITGMEPGDSYEVAVSAICSEESQSDPVTLTVSVPALVDIAIVNVYTNPSNCDLSDAIAQITVKNVREGSYISAFTASYTVNGGEAVTENVILTHPLSYGEEAPYEFATAPVFTDPANVLTATVFVEGESNLSDNTASSGVTYLTAVKDVPYVENFSGISAAQEWSVLDNNDDNSTFVVANNSIVYNSSDENAADDWVISPCVEYAPFVSYIFSFDYKANSPYYYEEFSAYVGTSNNPVEDYFIETFRFNNVENTHYDLVAYMTDDAPNMHFAFHAESEIGTAGFTIDNVSIKKAVGFSVGADENGTVAVNNAYLQYNSYYAGENEPITLAITPDFGYHVAAIYVNDVLVRGENTTNAAVDYFTFTPESGDYVYVTFTGNTYNVNATVNNYFWTAYNDNAPGAVYTPAHEQVVHGGSHTGVITLAQYYSLEYVTVNGADVTDDLEYIGNRQYQLTLDPVMEDKDITVLTSLDSAHVIYLVQSGQGTINNEFVVDDETSLPAIYVVTVPGYGNLMSTIVPAPGYHVSSIVIDGVEHTNIEAYYFEHLLGYHTVFVNFALNTYAITTSSIGEGTVSESVTFEYDPDYTYTFSATPAVGYHIASIHRNHEEVVVTNPFETYTETLTNILSDYLYEVEFAQNAFTITASCGANGTIAPNGVSSYYYHEDAEIVITADFAYYISSVTLDGVNYELPMNDQLTTVTIPIFNIEANHTISATFAPIMYNVTVNAGLHGTITPGTDSFVYGTTPTFTITPDAGYVIADVTVDGESVGAVSTYSFTSLDADHTIAATFAAQAFTITATAGNGGTITPAGVTNMAYNGNQSYTITPNSGYHVSDVFVDGASVGAVTTYAFTGVTADHTIFAEFAPNEYTVTVNDPAHATIAPGTMTVQLGATPAFVITPDLGYYVTAITVNGTNVNLNNVPNVNGVYTYTFAAISSNQTITATTAVKTYTIAASAGSNGTITPNGNTTVNHGNTQSYTITPANGYVVDNVTVDGMSMGALTGYTFTNVVANHTINATFKMAECEIPTFLYTSHIDSTSAELHWSHPAAGITFDIQYKTPTGTLTSVSNVSGNSYVLTNLNPGTTYLWQIRANCTNSNHSDWSNLVSFTTDNVLDNTGIEDVVKNSIKVYGEHQNVHILNNEGMIIESVRIFDAYGRLVYTGAVNTAHEVIGLNVAAGTYVVNVTTDKGIANYKVTLMK